MLLYTSVNELYSGYILPNPLVLMCSCFTDCCSGYDSRRYDGYDYDDEHDPEKGDMGEREGKTAHDADRPMSASPHDYEHRQAPMQKDPSEKTSDLERPASREHPATSREDVRKEMESKREDR